MMSAERDLILAKLVQDFVLHDAVGTPVIAIPHEQWYPLLIGGEVDRPSEKCHALDDGSADPFSRYHRFVCEVANGRSENAIVHARLG